MNFKNIGRGFVYTSKAGKRSIRLSLDPEARKQMADEDFAKNIYIFRSDKLDKNQNPIYEISVPMPDNYSKDSKVV